LACGVEQFVSTVHGLLGESFGSDPPEIGKKARIPVSFGVGFSPMDFGCVPSCGVQKGEPALDGAFWVNIVPASTTVLSLEGVEEEGGDFSLLDVGGFAGATEGRTGLVSSFALRAAAALSLLALASTDNCLGLRPAFLFCKYLGPLSDRGSRRASVLGPRYLPKYLSTEINPAKGSCTQLYSPRLLARARVLERALLVLPGPFQQLTPPF